MLDNRETPSPSASYTPRAILLVANDAQMAKQFIQTLKEKTRYHILFVSNVTQAFHICRSIRPDLVISEKLLNEMDGVTFCAHLRSIQGFEDIPSLLLNRLPDRTFVSSSSCMTTTDSVVADERLTTSDTNPMIADFLVRTIQELLI